MLFDSNKRAIGAEYMRGRSPSHSSPRLRVRARLSVILCAGAIHTPKLLMLSGVGDEGHLRKHGIEVVQHSPHVGEGLTDGEPFPWPYPYPNPNPNPNPNPSPNPSP